MTSEPRFNPYQQEFAADPYPVYARLRDQNPIFYSSEFGLTFFTRYRDIVNMLTDNRLGRVMTDAAAGEKQQAETRSELPFYDRYVRVNLLETEGANHSRLRRLLAKAINLRRIHGLRGRVQIIVDDLLDKLQQQREMDFLEDLAVPLPVQVISELLGWPAAERHRLRPWSAAIVRLYERNHTPEDESKAEVATEEFAAMLTNLAEMRRGDRKNDLISTLVLIESEGQRLSEDELIASCMMVLNAGHEATVNSAGNGLLALLRNPQQMAKLRSDPSLITTAVEEMLRYDSPLHFFHRFVLEDMAYERVELEKGDKVGLLYGSANRDPEFFDDADNFDIARHPNRHLAFGMGTHFCLGAPLARLELSILFNTMLRRFPDIRLADEHPEYHTGLVFRGLKRLRVKLTA